MKHTAFATFPSVKYLLTICCGCWAKLLSMDIKWRHFRLSQVKGRRVYSPFHKSCHHCLIGNDILHNGRSGEMVTHRVVPLFALLFTTRATICKKAVLASDSSDSESLWWYFLDGFAICSVCFGALMILNGSSFHQLVQSLDVWTPKWQTLALKMGSSKLTTLTFTVTVNCCIISWEYFEV